MSEITKYSSLSTSEFIQVAEECARQSYSTRSIINEAAQRLETLETLEDLQGLHLSAETVAVSELKELVFRDTESRHKDADDIVSDFLEAVGFEEVKEAWESALSCV